MWTEPSFSIDVFLEQRNETNATFIQQLGMQKYINLQEKISHIFKIFNAKILNSNLHTI